MTKSPSCWFLKASETQDVQTELGDKGNGNCHRHRLNSLLSEWVTNQSGEAPGLCNRLAGHAVPEVLIDLY